MKNILFDTFQFFLKVLDSLFPKSDNTIIFPLDSYKEYSDNRRFLFDSLSKSQEIDCIILFFNKENIVNKRYVNFYTLKGIIYWLRARCIVISHGTADIPFSHSIDYRRRRLVNIWHGISLKNLGYRMKNQNISSLELEFEKYDSMICSSTLDSLAMQSCFKKAERNMWLTGLPRNDLLFFNDSQISDDLKNGLNWINDQLNQRKMVLYMPTWRDDKFHNPKFNEREIAKLKLLLKSENAVLAVKIHPNAPPIDFGSLPIVNLSECPCPEVGLFLRKADVLITDYSSVWVDFLLLDRQIISYCPDISNYKKTRGLLYDYDLVFPGKINVTFESFLKELKISFSTSIISKQIRIKHLFHAFLDGKNSERVSKKILSSL
tara:strand:- start:198 stop:1328 length:1131 start_codon:yes stop_codon:yes gene_type:complete